MKQKKCNAKCPDGTGVKCCREKGHYFQHEHWTYGWVRSGGKALSPRLKGIKKWVNKRDTRMI